MANKLDGCRTVFGLAYNLDIVLGIDNGGQPPAHDGMVIG
jgi:hypothetical protein